MSYLPREYFDAAEGDNQDYEKTKPVSFREYLKKTDQKQKTPQEQASSPKFRLESTNEPQSSFRNYLAKKQPSETRGGDEPSIYNKYVERPAQIFGGGATAGLRATPRTGYDLIKMLSENVGGPLGSQIVKGLEYLEQNSPEKLKEITGKLFPSFEEVRERQQREGAPKPEGAIEGFLEKAGRFTGESAVPLIRGGQKIRQLTGIGGAAAGAQVGEELNLNPLAQVALALGGGFLGHKVGGGRGRGVAELSTQTMTPEVRRYVEASRDLGIDPLLTGMNPTQLQKVAQKWATHGHGGPDLLRQAYESRSGQVAHAFEEAMDQVGQNLFHEPIEAGEALRQGTRDATRQVEQTKSALYRDMDRTLPQDAAINVSHSNAFRTQLDQTIHRLDDSLAHSPAERGVDTRLNTIRENLQELIDLGPISDEVPIRNLQATQRSLRDVIRYDHPGRVDKLLIPLDREITGLLNRYAQTNPQYAQARTAANDYFKNNVVQIRQNVLQSIARGERPEEALRLMGSVSGIKNVQQALNNLPHGRRLFDSLRRFKLRSLIGDKIINPETGLMRLGGLKNFLSKKTDFYPVLRELAGPQAIERLQRLEHVGHGLEKGFNNLVNPSHSADVLVALNSILSPGKKIVEGLGKLPTPQGIAQTLGGVAQWFAPESIARMLLDPRFAEQVYEASQAANRGNWPVFNRRISSIADALKEEKSKSTNNENRS